MKKIEFPESLPDVSIEEIKRGYVWSEAEQAYSCLVCGARFVKGIVYPSDGVLYEAAKFAERHVEAEHGSMFEVLLALDKKATGLTDVQKTMLRYFRQGLPDNEIVRELGGSASTVRNHRFALRERAKQAKLFVAAMELAEEKADRRGRFVPVHAAATMTDDRYAMTEREQEETIRAYFPEGPDGPLAEFPRKEKRKLAILRHLIGSFEPGRKYAEKEVNEVLKRRFGDYVMLRRYLIEYGFMDREPDGSRYWVETDKRAPAPAKTKGATKMDKQKRKEIANEYAHSFRKMGVYQIRGKTNGKVYVGASMDLDGAFNRDRFMLDFGNFSNQELQQDWNELGEADFEFEILEQIKPREEYVDNIADLKPYKDELEVLKEIWLEKIEPYGERGYNKRPSARK